MRLTIAFGLTALAVTLGSGTSHGQEAEWRAFAESGWRAVRSGDHPAARELLEKARQLAEAFPVTDSRRILTEAYLACAAAHRGDRAEGERLLKDVAGRIDQLPLDAPHRGKAHLALALAARATEQTALADSQYRKAAEAEEKQRGPGHLVVVQLLSDRAALLESQGRFEEAEPLRKRIVEALDLPNDPRRSTLALTAHRQAGQMYRRWNHPDRAVTHYARVVELARGLRLPEEQLARHLTELGELYLAVRQLDRAGEPLQEALKIREEAFRDWPLAEQGELGRTLHAIGALYVAQGRFFPAEPVLERALKIREKVAGEELRMAETLHVMAVGHTGQRSFRKAETELLRALQIRESLLGAEHLVVAATNEDLAAVYTRATHVPAAEECLLKALAIREKAVGPDHSSVTGPLHVLANLYRDNQRSAEAEPLYQRVVLAHEKSVGPESPGLPPVLDDYAALLKQLNKPAEADKLTARAAAIRAKSPGKSP